MKKLFILSTLLLCLTASNKTFSAQEAQEEKTYRYIRFQKANQKSQDVIAESDITIKQIRQFMTQEQYSDYTLLFYDTNKGFTKYENKPETLKQTQLSLAQTIQLLMDNYPKWLYVLRKNNISNDSHSITLMGQNPQKIHTETKIARIVSALYEDSTAVRKKTKYRYIRFKKSDTELTYAYAIAESDITDEQIESFCNQKYKGYSTTFYDSSFNAFTNPITYKNIEASQILKQTQLDLSQTIKALYTSSPKKLNVLRINNASKAKNGTKTANEIHTDSLNVITDNSKHYKQEHIPQIVRALFEDLTEVDDGDLEQKDDKKEDDNNDDDGLEQKNNNDGDLEQKDDNNDGDGLEQKNEKPSDKTNKYFNKFHFGVLVTVVLIVAAVAAFIPKGKKTFNENKDQ